MVTSLKNQIYKLHPLERAVLPHTNLKSIEKIAKASNLTIAEATTGLQLLENKGFLNLNKTETKKIILDSLGLEYVTKELPEIRLLKKILKQEKRKSDIDMSQNEISVSIGILKKNNLIYIKKEDGELIFGANETAQNFLEDYENPLKQFKHGLELSSLTQEQKTLVKELKRRKELIKEVSNISYTVTLTPLGEKLVDLYKKDFKNIELIDELKPSMIIDKSWKEKEFRHYDINTETPILDIGRQHPMKKANEILSDIFIEMGFKEMEGPMVESAFWNMDIMWIPQDHPARDEQDTFYLDGTADVPKELMSAVKKMHEEGIKKTHTDKGQWSEQITKKRLLRTHSTATTFRMLYELGKKLKNGEDINGKYFYLANVFRNEAVDATHLAEFFQAEGFIIGDNLSLANLMGFIKDYYAKLGITKIRFKPTYNPYTEPSMEAHYYDPKLKKWYALINSGIFRPETLKPLGLENKTIIAWGMGASRVATLLSGKNSMREITGATCDYNWLKTRPLMNRNIIR